VENVEVATALPGKRFSKAHVLGPGGGSVPVTGRGSTLVLVWYHVPNLSTQARMLSSRSTNDGRTWSRPHVMASGVNARLYAPFPAVVWTGSRFVVCWQENTVFPRERIACSHSSNGLSWSRPRIVAQPRGAGDADQPALATSPNGRVWLAFYRSDHGATSVELWSSRKGDTWRERAVLMSRAVPRSGSFFLGDYQGLIANGKWVLAAFTMPVRAGTFRQVVQISRFPATG
jgi:BNR repeat protein